MLTALAMIHRDDPCRLVVLAAVVGAIGANSFQAPACPAIASNPCRHHGGVIWATAGQISVSHGMIVQYLWPRLLDAWEFGKLVLRFFDKASFPSLFLLALVTYEVGRRSCGVRHQQIARLLAGGLLLVYFVYRFVVFHDHGWEQLLVSAARAFLAAWLSVAFCSSSSRSSTGFVVASIPCVASPCDGPRRPATGSTRSGIAGERGAGSGPSQRRNLLDR